MKFHPLAGKLAPKSMLINIPKLLASYYTIDPSGMVSFGTSGHRGCSFKGTFNEMHIASTAQAICEYRSSKGITGPLYLGFDTHAISEAAFRTSLEVFAANEVEVIIHDKDEYSPTPVISFLILEYNKTKSKGFADGVVITPSHNPPQDGGFKYNPPQGGPADVNATGWIQNRAKQPMNKILLRRLLTHFRRWSIWRSFKSKAFGWVWTPWEAPVSTIGRLSPKSTT